MQTFFFACSTHKCKTCICFIPNYQLAKSLNMAGGDRFFDELYIAPPDVHEESDCDSADLDQEGLSDNLSGRQLQSEAECVLTNGNRLGRNNCDEGHLYLWKKKTRTFKHPIEKHQRDAELKKSLFLTTGKPQKSLTLLKMLLVIVVTPHPSFSQLSWHYS